ncbi:uncharacterized protein ACIBXB_004885 [Morphnus guianensis]
MRHRREVPPRSLLPPGAGRPCSRSYRRGGERERSRKKRLNWQSLLAAPRNRAVMCCRKGVVMLSRCPILWEAPPPWGRQCGLSGVGSRTQRGIAVADYPRRVYLLWITWVEPLVKVTTGHEVLEGTLRLGDMAAMEVGL